MADIATNTLQIGGNNLILQDAAVRSSLANAYSASSTYAVGDMVLKDGQLYECNTAISTAEAWTSAHWTAVTVGEKVADLEAETNTLEEDISHIGGLSEDIKLAMLQIAEKVAYIDDQGQTYYDALYDALYPPADLVSISAVYTQSGTVYDTDSLDSLKSDLVVTAHMSDSTTQTITTYSLSGTLTEGTSTITVSYSGKTTSFNVTVSHNDRGEIFGTFVNGHSVSKITSGTTIPKGGIYISSATARAAFSTPIENKGYTFTVTDSTKYNIAVYDVADDTPISTPLSGAIEHVYYTGGSKTISWQATDSATTPYILIAIKKIDNSAFTDAELANGAEAVFDFTTS